MKKFVIKKCPNHYYESIYEHPHRCNLTDGDWSCDVANTPEDEYGFKCLLKRIADLCKAEKDKGFIMSRHGVKVPVSASYNLASEILELLEIEECENE